MKYRSLLKEIASQIALVFVLFFVIQSEAFAIARGGGGGRGGGAGGGGRGGVEEVAAFRAKVRHKEADFRLVGSRPQALEARKICSLPAAVAGSCREAQAGDSAQPQMRDSGERQAPRIKRSASKLGKMRQGQAPRIKLNASKPSKMR